MEKNLMSLEKEFLLKELEDSNIRPSEELHSIILVGGKGTRLNPERKLISKENFPELNPIFLGQQGPKGLAIMSCSSHKGNIKKPMTDFHLDIHTFSPNIKKIILSLGTSADMLKDYYQKKHNSRYNQVPVEFLVEKNPAGTLAPIIKLYQADKLSSFPTVLANGDNLIDIDLYHGYLAGCLYAHNLGMDLNETVIQVLSFVPWEESHAYGTIDVDFSSGLVKGFKEKSPVKENVHMNINCKEMTPINSGFSIILNPAKLLPKYLTKEIIETSNKLEEGLLEYKGNENIVKYETLYGRLAAERKMVAVYLPVYWTDLGTEEKLLAAEVALQHTSFFKASL